MKTNVLNTQRNRIRNGDIDSFIKQLHKTQFEGDTHSDIATRLTQSTDNSIYSFMPQLVLYPKTTDDIKKIIQLIHQDKRFNHLKVVARGGGTGCNGQSLTSSISLDCSKYLTKILQVDEEKRRVTVQPGVCLADLNQALKPHRLMFAPSLGPSSRATLGGMISTDACGKGSGIYGRTSEYIHSLDVVLSTGDTYTAMGLSNEEKEKRENEPTKEGELLRGIATIIQENKAIIKKHFKPMKRFLTGYDLAHCMDESGGINISRVIAGSEGTLGCITQATLNVVPIPSYKRLWVCGYKSLDEALEDAETLRKQPITALELMDDTLVTLGKQVSAWPETLRSILKNTQVMCIVEVASDTPVEKPILSQSPYIKEVEGVEEQQALWRFRKEAVGFLANTKGGRQYIPFIEDTAVPLNAIKDYINDCKILLKSHGVEAVIYGHLDVGCIHIRPLLDLTRMEDKKIMESLLNQIAKRVVYYDGVVWGEHGRGLRSSVMPDLYGEEFYQVFQKVKTLFDPHNRLNPGKIAVPTTTNDTLIPLTEKLKADQEHELDGEFREYINPILNCNGNGVCMSHQGSDWRCPSYVATNDRVQSPKGRAVLLREWAIQYTPQRTKKTRLQPFKKLWNTVTKRLGKTELIHDVHKSLETCLNCNACTTGCPANVDIPTFKSYFLNQYHHQYSRSLASFLLGRSEKQLKILAGIAPLINVVLSITPLRTAIEGLSGIVNIPKLNTPKNYPGLRKRMTKYPLTHPRDPNTLYIFQDAYTSFCNTSVLQDTVTVLGYLGKNVIILPYQDSGKAWQVGGFKEKAEDCIKILKNQFITLESPVMIIEPSIQTYLKKELKGHGVKHNLPLSVEEVLLKEKNKLSSIGSGLEKKAFTLLSHCYEQQKGIQERKDAWQVIFKACNLNLKRVDLGCCGMAGGFGHQKQQRSLSKKIFDHTWAPHLNEGTTYLATGYSCRAQLKRFFNQNINHPITHLAKRIHAR